MKSIALVFVNGKFVEKLSSKHLLPENIEFRSAEGLFLRIPKNQAVNTPIYLKFLSSGTNDFTCSLQNTVIVEENSKVVLIEEYMGNAAENYIVNVATELRLGKNACMDYYKLQNEKQTATHAATILIEQQESSCMKMFAADFGSHSARVELRVKLHERYASCFLRGLYLLNADQQQLDNYIHIDHIAEYGTSSMFYKGILEKKSRALFNGKVHVHKNAQHTNAHQANHNLLLSPQAEVNTQPQLEIYADDIKCTHGATVGQLDDEALFYLRSRGIDKSTALKLLAYAFTTEIMNEIEDPVIRQYVQERVNLHEEL